MVGEGGTLTVDVSQALIHRQITMIGSWVTSTTRMSELLGNLVVWGLHPDRIVTHRYPLEDGDAAYRTADSGASGKVAITS